VGLWIADRGLGADAEAEVTRRPIRVLHLRDSPWVDGPGRTVLETASRIDRSRIDYHIGAFVTDESASHALVQAAEERALNVHRIRDERGVSRQLVRTVVELLNRLDIDVLHTSEFRSNVLGLLCRRQRSVRLVSTAHGWIANDAKGRVYTWFDRLLLRRFDRVILVSHAMRKRLPEWWIADERVCVLQNALMIESYGRAVSASSRRVPDPRQDVRLLNVGRLSPEKGQRLLLEVVAGLRPQFPGLRLAFAGVGPEEPRLRQVAAALRITDCVSFLGYVADMPPLYADVDLVVQSSFTEGLPNVMLEAAYLGVPVVATDVGGTPEVIQHGQSGWLVSPRSASALAAGLRAYLERPASFIAMAGAGRRLVETHFSFDARTAEQMRIYEQLVADSRR
jgi:glycosyltransferase involved in cell wall biosynthesis